MMPEQSKGKIFVAEERGKSETNAYRSWKTFNCGSFFNENKIPFGNLYMLNDDTLSQMSSVKMLVEEESYVVFLPVAGALIYSDSTGYKTSVAVGEMAIRYILPGTVIHIENPFENNLINYLQIRFKPAANVMADINIQVDFDVDLNRNNLVHLIKGHNNLGFNLSIVKLSGRSEITYNAIHNNSGIYAYVIEGALEVQHRLLQDRDGLALWEQAHMEAEALSNDAILLIAEVSL